MANKPKTQTQDVQTVETPIETVEKVGITAPVETIEDVKPAEVIKTVMDKVQDVKAKAQSDYDKAVASLTIVRH